MTIPRATSWVLTVLILSGCSGDPARPPVAVFADASSTSRERRDAMDSMLALPPASLRDAEIALLRQLLVDERADSDRRRKAFVALVNHPNPEIADAARESARRLLPQESSRAMVAQIAQTAAERSWTDFVPALVRSYRRPVAGVSDAERGERAAIAALSPGGVEQGVMSVFLDAPDEPATHGLDWTKRTREDAWELLSRLDTSGESRRRLLASADASGDPLLAALVRAQRELRVLPATAMELAWVSTLAGDASAARSAWWTDAASAIRSLGEGSVRLRHAEAVRLAGARNSARLARSREELQDELAQRLAPRTLHTRTWANGTPRYHETLARQQGRLSRGDLLAILAIDDALRTPGVREALFRFASLDRDDTTTEYGGTVSDSPEGFAATLYPPRPGERRGDQQFVASREMLSSSDTALAHFHFHAQAEGNREYAGPSEGDLEYAAASGRSCLVFTSLSADLLGVDYYHADGDGTADAVVLDLGEIRP
jgi:hypothetical protein